MDFADWLKDGTLRRSNPSRAQVTDLLASANSDIDAAQELAGLGRLGIARDTAYEAMLKSGLALMLSQGYRPETGSHHVTVVRYAERVLGPESGDLIASFDRLRRTRHQRLYQGKEKATRSEVEQAVEIARRFAKVVKEAVLI